MKLLIPIRVDAWANMRGHWRTQHKKKNKEKQATSTLLAFQGELPELPVVVTFTRFAPRFLDCDNLPSAFKYIRDEIAKHYNSDDSPSALFTWIYQQEKTTIKDTTRYSVCIEIRRINEKQIT